MAIDTSVPRSRRAVLAGGIAGLVAAAAAALGRPNLVRAGSDGDVVLGGTNTSDTTTLISNTTTTETALKGVGTLGDGLGGESAASARAGVSGSSTNAHGLALSGVNQSLGATGFIGGSLPDTEAGGASHLVPVGVYGHAGLPEESAFGVFGSTFTGAGVYGTNLAGGAGVIGHSPGDTGVRGIGVIGVHAVGGRGAALIADNASTSTTPTIIARSTGGRAAVHAVSGVPDPSPSSPVKTGVFGYAAQDASARGVIGQTTAGRGVNGIATTGTAGHFATTDPTKGYALRAVGRVKLDQCAGLATIATGKSSVVVKPGIDLVATSAVVATLQGSAGGATTVRSAAVNTVTNTFTISLTAPSRYDVKVAWHVFG